MLQKLNDRVAECLMRAASAEERARRVSSDELRTDNERVAHNWRLLARSFQFVESPEHFLLDSAKAKISQTADTANSAVTYRLRDVETGWMWLVFMDGTVAESGIEDNQLEARVAAFRAAGALGHDAI